MLSLERFKYVEGGRNLPNNKFTRNEMMEIKDIPKYRLKNGNKGIYLSAYLYDDMNVNEANLYGNFYLDFDSEDDFEIARRDALNAIWYLEQKHRYNIPKDFMRIFFSGKKGLHIVIPAQIFGVEPDKNLNEYYKLMAQDIASVIESDTIDQRIYDRRRLFRIQNSVHASTGLYKVPLTYFELSRFTYDEIKEKAKSPIEIKYPKSEILDKANREYRRHIERWNNRYKEKFDKKKNFESKPLDFTPACIQELIQNGPVKGKRNNTAAALTSFWKKQGGSEQEVWDRLVKWNGGSITESELKNTMTSVYKNNYEYGCSTLETLATCVGKQCPLFKEKDE